MKNRIKEFVVAQDEPGLETAELAELETLEIQRLLALIDNHGKRELPMKVHENE